MSELVTSTAKLLPYGKRSRSVPSFAIAYAYEPEPAQEHGLGSLYVVLEVMAPQKQAEEVADLIIKTFGEVYYNEEGPDDAAERVERAVKSVNRELTAYTQKGRAAWVGRLSAVAAVMAGGQLHLTQTGSAEAYLWRHGQASHISEGLSPEGPHRPERTFGNIASGQLEVADKILLSTPALLHQIGIDTLKDYVRDNSPSTAARKISDSVGTGDGAERVAALIVEVTTPERLASQVLPEEKEVVQVGQPQTLTDKAQAVGGPVVEKLQHHSKQGAQAAWSFWKETGAPFARHHALRGASWLRKALRRPGGARVALVVAMAVIVAVVVFSIRSADASAVQQGVKTWDNAYSLEQKAENQVVSGDKAGAQQSLNTAKQETDQLAKSKHAKEIDAALAKRHLSDGSPTSIAALSQLISSESDAIEGLRAADTSTVTTLKSAHPALLTATSSLLVAADDHDLYLVTPSNGAVKTVPLPPGIGQIKAATQASTGSGIYLLTATPSVWLFSTSNASFTKQQTSAGSWPAASAISSYAGNLYTLTGADVMKQTPTAAGFSDPNSYLKVTGGTCMWVDGSIIVGGGQGTIRRYFAGKLEETASDVPDALTHPIAVASSADGNLIATLDGSTDRIGLFVLAGTKLTYLKQYGLNVSDVHGFVLNSNSRTIYVLAGSQILKFSYSS